jgi:hypothetical protein
MRSVVMYDLAARNSATAAIVASLSAVRSALPVW